MTLKVSHCCTAAMVSAAASTACSLSCNAALLA
jgi:hypothetical protein